MVEIRSSVKDDERRSLADVAGIERGSVAGVELGNVADIERGVGDGHSLFGRDER